MPKSSSACKLRMIGENIAYGYTSDKYVGAVKDSDGTWWVSQVFGTVN
ncbi:MAG: hypothetical protein ABIR57_05935 [Aeromicrobium sp.]